MAEHVCAACSAFRGCSEVINAHRIPEVLRETIEGWFAATERRVEELSAPEWECETATAISRGEHPTVGPLGVECLVPSLQDQNQMKK